MAEPQQIPPTTKMAEPQQIPPTFQEKRKKLKYLDFVQVAAEYVRVRLSTVYECVKDNSGPLKSGVQTVESKVRIVIGPVYDKFHNVPFELLNFVDGKVDELITEVDRHLPSIIKQASSQASAVASEIQQAGVVDTARNMAKTMYTKYEEKVKEYYSKYEPLAKHYAVLTWSSLNRLPLVSLACLLQFRLMGNLLWMFKFLFNLVGLLRLLMRNLFRRLKFLFNLLWMFKMGLHLGGWGSIVRLRP